MRFQHEIHPKLDAYLCSIVFWSGVMGVFLQLFWTVSQSLEMGLALPNAIAIYKLAVVS